LPFKFNLQRYSAVVEIQEALDDSTLCGADPLTTSRANLRLARWSAATGQRQKTDVLHIYSNVLRDQKHTEKANFHVAKYMDDLLKDALRREQQRAAAGGGTGGAGAGAGAGAGSRSRGRNFDVDEHSIDYVIEIVTHYATSLRYGHRHVYESLPRMLTLWFDVGAAAAAHEAAAAGGGSSRAAGGGSYTSSRAGGGGAGAGGAGGGGLTAEQQKERKVATQITNTLKGFTQTLPLYTWLPALPQLTSRLCHPHAEVRQVVHELLYRLVKNFPNQVLWWGSAR
jgi:serine/threonine-protein kinase ATR